MGFRLLPTSNCVAEFVTPEGVYTLRSIGDSSIPKSVKRTHSTTKAYTTPPIIKPNSGSLRGGS